MSDSFAHSVRIDSIRDGDRLELAADEAERNAVAKRLGLGAIDRLEGHATLERKGDVVRARGRLVASLEQSCVVTGEPVPAHVDEPFSLVFVPEPQIAGGDEEIELGEEDCDTVFHDGAVIDLGGAIADTLALSLDPYPRSAEADAALKDAGVISEEQASPFAALAQLKRGLEGS
jgi:uncharacterized metal-binding protein YceD (DUF177 family)